MFNMTVFPVLNPGIAYIVWHLSQDDKFWIYYLLMDQVFRKKMHSSQCFGDFWSEFMYN